MLPFPGRSQKTGQGAQERGGPPFPRLPQPRAPRAAAGSFARPASAPPARPLIAAPAPAHLPEVPPQLTSQKSHPSPPPRSPTPAACQQRPSPPRSTTPPPRPARNNPVGGPGPEQPAAPLSSPQPALTTQSHYEPEQLFTRSSTDSSLSARAHQAAGTRAVHRQVIKWSSRPTRSPWS